MSVGAPKENTNAEKWTLNEAEKVFIEAVEMAYQKDKDVYKYDFVGEIARELKLYKEVFTYLKEKFPNNLSELHKELISTLEANCFYNSKKGNINTAIGIVNLKSNHGWTDRQQTDVTTNGKELNNAPIIQFIDTEDGDKIQ